MQTFRKIFFFTILAISPLILSCQTKAAKRNQQELVRLKREMRAVRGNKADVDVTVEEVRMEQGRLANRLEERAQYQQQQFDQLRLEIAGLTSRVQALEQNAVAQKMERAAAPPAEAPSSSSSSGQASYSEANKLFKAKKYGQAISVIKEVIRRLPRGQDRHSRFLLSEAHFYKKDYAQAAIEYGEFIKRYPKDSAVALAIYRQANCFRAMKKTKEARLFYEELIDRFPRSSFAKKAKSELKSL